MPQNFVLHTEIQNGPHSMTYLTCDHTRKCKKKTNCFLQATWM